jgi:hypothetical protein
MFTFRFTVDGDLCEFQAKQDNKSIRNALEQNYPNCQLELDYCQCMDACSCNDGHYITTSKWVSPNILTPWIGSNVDYRVPLLIVLNGVASDYSDPSSGNRFY